VQMTSDTLAALSSSRNSETAALMQKVGATILKSSSPISAPRADLRGDNSLQEDIRLAAGELCEIVTVDATTSDREAYLVRSHSAPFHVIDTNAIVFLTMCRNVLVYHPLSALSIW
jgi:hypothetical protein